MNDFKQKNEFFKNRPAPQRVGPCPSALPWAPRSWGDRGADSKPEAWNAACLGRTLPEPV